MTIALSRNTEGFSLETRTFFYLQIEKNRLSSVLFSLGKLVLRQAYCKVFRYRED